MSQIPREALRPVAHAVHLDKGGVVAVGDLSLGLGDGELNHVAPAMGQCHRQFDVLTDRHVVARRCAAIEVFHQHATTLQAIEHAAGTSCRQAKQQEIGLARPDLDTRQARQLLSQMR